MEKVILITSREIGKANFSLFKEIKYGPILMDCTAPDIKGYFRQFLEWVYGGKDQRSGFKDIVDSKNLNENEKIDNCKKIVSALLANNEPKNEDKPFKLGVFKRKIDTDGLTIYIAEEFPCKGDDKRMFTEAKQRYLNSIVMEIIYDMGSTDLEWLVLSHDNDWGKEGDGCLKAKGKDSSVIIESTYSDLNSVVANKENTEIHVFRHVDSDDIYMYVQNLMED